MYRKIYTLKTFAVMAVLIAVLLLPGCGFYKADTEFNFDISPNQKQEIKTNTFRSGQLYAIFTEQTTGEMEYQLGRRLEYRFLPIPERNEFFLYIPVNAADALPLQPDTEYTIIYNVDYYGYNIESLYIIEDDTLIFAGVTDLSADGNFEEYEQYLPCDVKQTALLTNHRQGKSECVDSKTNTEITFTSKTGDKLVLHQGQSGKLGNYQVHLRVAQDVEFDPYCCDYYENEFSFTIMKKP